MIVDDEESIRCALEEALGDDFFVKTVLSGDEAIREIDKSHYDLLITDFLQPGSEKNGLDVFLHAKSTFNECCQVIFITGDEAFLEEAEKRLNPELFEEVKERLLVKPFNLHVLRTLISEVMKVQA